MGSRAALVGGLGVLFAIVVVVLIKVLPGPHKSTDYLVIGTLATLFCIVIVFLVSLSSSGKARDMFYKRRK